MSAISAWRLRRLISGVDHLISKGFIDRDRVARWDGAGRLHLGIITCYAIASGRVGGCGPFRLDDVLREYGHPSLHAAIFEATPSGGLGDLSQDFAVSYVERAKTPTLIQHGELDKRVPIPNAYELYQALQGSQRACADGCLQGLRARHHEAQAAVHLQEQNYEWFSEWVWW